MRIRGLVAAFVAATSLTATAHAGEYNPVVNLLDYFGGLDEFRADPDKKLTALCDEASSAPESAPMLTAYLCNAAGHTGFLTVSYNAAIAAPPEGHTAEQEAGRIYIAVDEAMEAVCKQQASNKARPAYISALCNTAGYGGYQKPCEKKEAKCR